MESAPLKNKKITAFILVILYLGCIFLYAQDTPKTYIAQKTIDTIIIDGKPNEISWQKAKWTDLFIDIEGELQPKYHTKLKMIWDTGYLYFFAELKEPHVWATLKQRDTVIFYNNDFEIFIDPQGDTHNYYEYEMNALNTVWDLFLSKPYRNNGTILGDWDFKGLRSAVDIQGTLNDPSDTDEGWSLEVAIPWSFTTAPGGKTKIPENKFWRMNFSRVNWDFNLTNGTYSRKKNAKTGEFLPEYNWVWSPQGVINMHEPEHWGYVYFSGDTVGDKSVFEIPKDEHIKWYLYEIYRNIRAKDSKTSKWQPINTEVYVKPKEILGKTVVPILENCTFGYVLWAKSPFSKKTLTIHNDGKFESHENK
ncbi:carbohydrate-binding family 9-like protein [Spongiimicrobium sp. 3-5]|uniref:carbohydrate-binding family 9-like protein n=1 Tax=Spongiimicrobium sp. 3-5 TaxID=3332596 RepID=UPI0039810771